MRNLQVWYGNPPFLLKPPSPPFSNKNFQTPPFPSILKKSNSSPFMKGEGEGGQVESMEEVNPVTYLLSMSQCILSLHVSNVSLMVLNWSSCLNIHKIILVVVSSQKFCNCLLTTSFLNIVLLKIVTSDSKNLRGQCFQISVNYFRSPTTFVFTF